MSNFTEKQQKDLAYFKSNLQNFLENKLLLNKYIVISDGEIQISSDTLENALNFAVENYRPGDYIIQQVIDESKIVSFIKAAIV